MTPAAGDRLLRFVGDRVKFALRTADGSPLPKDWRVLLRTNLGRGRLVRHEIIHSYPRRPSLAGAAWHDLPLEQHGGEWSRELTLTEPGFFRAKAYAVDSNGYQHWPDGDDVGISVHPDQYRTNNTIYCAFTRMFGPTKHLASTSNPAREEQLSALEKEGYTVIPPSGKFRDLIRELPFIVDTLGCRILQLLPVNPTPTVFAKFGRFGSPYASQDLTAVDPALVEFDKRTTGVDQFRELTYAAHAHGARVFIDIVINHTGWGARLQETHPEWYVRDQAGNFVSPGAWGVTWEDLTELDHRNPELWHELAEVFLVWCRRGVDGFRCDAGYKVPLRAWRYITARVLEEFPETVFFLEGLGGSWEATELLLTEGGMQWAYSELFQNYSGMEISSYLEYALLQSQRLGTYVHYSETHDNNRLADRGRQWSLLRNQLCALTSVSGAFGFACGVEWLASEKINVHSNRGLSWGNSDNLVKELATLTTLLREHSCFFDGAKLRRVTSPHSPVFALLRESADGSARVLCVINTDMERVHIARFDSGLFSRDEQAHSAFNPKQIRDLLGQELPEMHRLNGWVEFAMRPGLCYCLELGKAAHSVAIAPKADGRAEYGVSQEVEETGLQYRQGRARAAWAVAALSKVMPAEDIGPFDWRILADWVNRDPRIFLGAVTALDLSKARHDLERALFEAFESLTFHPIVTWQMADARRITLVPASHWVLIRDVRPFRAALSTSGPAETIQSVEVAGGHVACFSPRDFVGDGTLLLERYDERNQTVSATLRYLPQALLREMRQAQKPRVVLLTNGRGGMARLAVDLGQIYSKYDCLLGANLHADLPVDRHIFAKRVRVWMVADGFITQLNGDNLIDFHAGPPARWRFVANAGNGRSIEVEVTAEMVQGENTTKLRFRRVAPNAEPNTRSPADAHVSLTVRVDIEDRNFHCETKRNDGANHHFSTHTHLLTAGTMSGFLFSPSTDRQLRVFTNRGQYHAQPEWALNIAHPVEASRGQEGLGDAYSPGWFEVPLAPNDHPTLVVTAEPEAIAMRRRSAEKPSHLPQRSAPADAFAEALLQAAKAFVVRRGSGKTVIAGYPWFLDWGRDTLICARGLIAGGLLEEVREILTTFARFEDRGTLPNTIHGENASNRDTSDAPLWFGVACEELAAAQSHTHQPDFFAARITGTNRTFREVLRSIAENYVRGTPNGIHMDASSALIWSPSHFTWMDTNYPAGTPREGYPVEIQVLWIRLLRLLARIDTEGDAARWKKLAEQAEDSLRRFFWFEEHGYLSDVLLGAAGTPARNAIPDTALRSNYLLAISLGVVDGESARRGVENAVRHLVVPGALRSLAPLPVSPPLPIYSSTGSLLNDPLNPYWPTYEGDEDTRRKPAYHNGTAWTWTFPTFCEALVLGWNRSPEAIAAAQSYLLSTWDLMQSGCAGHLPEVCDGDAPHVFRGCDAQSWSVTEALRVWKWLKELSGGNQ